MANTFKFGTNGNWAVKEDYALAYNDENGNFKPLPFDFTRASSATRVNKDGLIENVPSGKPRIDFLDNTSGHLLLEPSRKNDITDYTGASFSAFNGASITANDSVSPDGSTNATLMTTTGSANELIQQASITIFSGQSYTVSGYFKLKSGTLSDPDNAFKGLDGLNGGGITGSTFNSTLTSEWQRLSFTVTSSTTSGRVQIKCEDAAEILVWGLQVEQGSYATSLIQTSGSTVTRSADDVDTDYGDKNTLSDEVSVYFNLLPQVSDASNTNKCLSFGFNSSNVNNSYAVLRFNSTNWSSRIQGTTGNNFDNLGVSQTTEIKAVMVLTQSGYSLYANGSTAVASGSYGGTAPTINSVAFVQILNDTDDRGVYKIKELKVYNTALTEAEAQALTS